MAVKIPPADRKWCSAARELWRSTHQKFVLADHHITLLREACHQLNRAHEAREELAEHGLTVTDRYACTSPSKFLEVERASLNTCRLLLRELGLDTGNKNELVRLHRGSNYA